MNEAITDFLAGKKVSGSFDIHIEGDIYQCDQVLRLLPGRRLVVKARHHGESLLLKLFVPNKKGWRELSREQHGYRLCKEAGISVPAEKMISDNFAGCLAVAYEFIEHAHPLNLSANNHVQQIQALLDLMVRCHQAGIYQQDIHPDNILVTDNRLWLIDLASVKGQAGQPLSQKKSLRNLALLIAQFVPDQQHWFLEKLSLYYKAREWPFYQVNRTAFKNLLDKTWQKRKQTYLSKCFRACSMTAYKKTSEMEYAFKRSFFKSLGEASVRRIDELVELGTVIKAGNSATVVRTELAGRQVVIKRYNIKSPWHFLKRCWRPSRAANAWRQGNLMELLGIATPGVLGFVEQRHGVFRGKAYLISDYVENASELSAVYADKPPSTAVLRQIKRIFNLMRAYRLSHGDMKASNLLLTQHGQVELLDLDAMREHRHEWTFQRAFARDQRRFLKNWSDKQDHGKLEESLLK